MIRLPDSFSEQICQLFVEIRFNNVVEKKALKQFGSGGFSYLKGQQKVYLTNIIFACLLTQVGSIVVDIMQKKTYNGVPVSKGLGKELGGL